MKRIAITGANGFIGQNLIRFFYTNHPEIEVVSIERTLDIAPLTKRLQGCDLAIHLSSLFVSEHQPHQIGPLVESHIHFSTCLLEAIAHTGTPHFVQISSIWQNSHDQGRSPANLYAAMKSAFEQILKYYVSSFTLNAICLELPDTFGPNDPRDKLLNKIHRALLISNNELPLTTGEQEVDILAIGDAVMGIALAAKRVFDLPPHSFERYRLSSGKIRTVKELVKFALQAARKSHPTEVDSLRLLWGALPYRKREVFQIPQLTPGLPGFKAQADLEIALEEFFSLNPSELTPNTNRPIS